jgi:hypothetical protein
MSIIALIEPYIATQQDEIGASLAGDSPSKNEAWFQKVGLFFAGIGWPDGQDLGPDTVAAHLIPLTGKDPQSFLQAVWALD